MRITEIFTESELQHLEEGPKLDAFGRGVGKFVGGVAKGVGAVAGGVVGAGKALAKGYRTGKAVVGDDPDPGAGSPGYQDPVEPAAAAGGSGATAPAPSGATAPTVGGTMSAPSTTTPPSAADINAQGPQGSAPAVAQSGAAGQALAKSTSVVDQQQSQSQTKANQTVYAQVKANVDKLDKKGKQRILQLLQKSLTAPDPKPAAGKSAGAGAFSNMASTLAGGGAAEPAAPAGGTMSAPAAAPAGTAMPTTPYQTPGAGTNPNPTTAAAPTKARGGRAAGAAPSQSASAVRRRDARAAAAGKAKAGNAAFGGMANTLQQQNASREYIGNSLSEALAAGVEHHRQKMFETGLSKGTFSIFKK